MDLLHLRENPLNIKLAAITYQMQKFFTMNLTIKNYFSREETQLGDFCTVGR